MGLGPEREFLNLVPAALVDAGLLERTTDGSQLLAPTAAPVAACEAGAAVGGGDSRRDEFEALGWLLGYVLLNLDKEVAIPGLALSPAVLRALLGHRTGVEAEQGWRAALEDLEAADPDLHKCARGLQRAWRPSRAATRRLRWWCWHS